MFFVFSDFRVFSRFSCVFVFFRVFGFSCFLCFCVFRVFGFLCFSRFLCFLVLSDLCVFFVFFRDFFFKVPRPRRQTPGADLQGHQPAAASGKEEMTAD